MPILTIESTCDETAAAVIARGPIVLGAALANQEAIHQRFRGVVPELAARAHVARILPVIDESLRSSGVQPQDLTAIAVANQPGLAGSLLVGLCAAKTLCVAWQKPLVTLNHLYAHIYACQIDRAESVFPAVGLVVSGGHTSLYDCRTAIDFEFLGGTIDDAAGEAFDKVAAMLNLPYPGGPNVSRAAETGDPKAYRFPRSMIDDTTFDFSFSGLKTAVRYALVGPGRQDFAQLELSEQKVADVCASFQAAVIETLVTKSCRAVRSMRHSRLCVGGGVAANRLLRDSLADAARLHGFELYIAPPNLCTDNAVMGAIAWELFDAGRISPLDTDIHPGLHRPERYNTVRY